MVRVLFKVLSWNSYVRVKFKEERIYGPGACLIHVTPVTTERTCSIIEIMWSVYTWQLAPFEIRNGCL
jgi:hypothetical protein